MTENQESKIESGRRRLQFEVYVGTFDSDGSFKKTRLVGLGFLREGKLEYKVKLFPRLNDRFYVWPNDTRSGSYRVMVKDVISTKNKPPRTYWCEVGEGTLISRLGLMEIKIDLCSRPFYMSIFPRKANPQTRAFAKMGDLKLVPSPVA